jgi:hypothetical protein
MAALALAIAAPAGAATIMAQFTGAIVSGVDDNGFFGAPGADLTGDAVTATFMIDTSNGAMVLDPPQMSRAYGGGVFGSLSPVSASLEINGDTFILTGTYDGEVIQLAPPSGQSALQYSVEDRNTFPGGYVDFSMAGAAASPSDNFVTNYDLRQPPQVVPIGDLAPGSFSMGSFDAASGQLTASDVLTWQPTALSISVLSSAPEPEAWILMLAGFTGIGAAIRIARRKPGAVQPQ